MKRLLSFVCGTAMTLAAMAVPANPKPVVMIQPDGTQVTARLCGDEFYHFSTTIDGYTIVKNTQGAWVYAIKKGEDIVASNVLAHDAEQRTADELSLLSSTPRGLTNGANVKSARRLRAAAQGPSYVQYFDYSKFHGLIVLVQPSDVSFSYGEAQEVQQLYSDMVNVHDYQGYDQNSTYGRFTGSVRDYYYDNSMGQFDPVFDVVGPVTVSYTSTQFNNGSRPAFNSALSKLNNSIDYSIYDTDNNGYVDMVFFIVAGYGSHVQGNPSGLLWPHMSRNLNIMGLDGVKFDRYACSTEMEGAYNSGYLDGIGTICHEFSHVLGLPDLYDTDYATNGQSHEPGEWDIMAGGSYLNNARTPAGYGIFERYALGFANPTIITEKGDYSMQALGTSNEGFIVKSPVNKEFFMIENRQATKWDSYLPGHGMIVVRVDSTNTSPWNDNEVNDRLSHNYYEIVRAAQTPEGNGLQDAFPGSTGTSRLGASTLTQWKTWSGQTMPRSLNKIVENNGLITFSFVDESDINMLEETFESMPVTTAGRATGVQGDITIWDYTNCDVQEPDNEHCLGVRSIGMWAPSMIRMSSNTDKHCYAFSADIYNQSINLDAKFKLYYSDDNGTTWKEVPNSVRTIPAYSKSAIYWKFDFDTPVRFRLNMTSGTKNKALRCYVDNVTIYYDGELQPEFPLGDVDGSGVVDIEDVNAAINIILKTKTTDQYPGSADLDNNGVVDIEDVNAIINIILKV